MGKFLQMDKFLQMGKVLEELAHSLNSNSNNFNSSISQGTAPHFDYQHFYLKKAALHQL